jgi:hypothetical protein
MFIDLKIRETSSAPSGAKYVAPNGAIVRRVGVPIKISSLRDLGKRAVPHGRATGPLRPRHDSVS